MNGRNDDPTEETFEAIVSAAVEQFGQLADAEVDGWASSALGLWREPGDGDPFESDQRLLAYLDASPEPVAARLAAAVRGLLSLGSGPAPDRALSVRTPHTEGQSVALGFCAGSDLAHSLLADIDATGCLRDLQLGPPLDELEAGFDETVVTTEPLDHVVAARAVADAWQVAAVSGAEPTSAQVANDALARARLAAAGHHDLPRPAVPVAVVPAVDPEADAASLVTLAAALPSVASGPTGDHAAVVAAAELVRWDDPPWLPRAELEALATLEWADWLGAVIGLVRSGVGSEVTAAGLVDHVNRCPEVSGSIPKRDRPWFEHAFAIVIEQWREASIVGDDDRLTEVGALALPAALRLAWTRVPEG